MADADHSLLNSYPPHPPGMGIKHNLIGALEDRNMLIKFYDDTAKLSKPYREHEGHQVKELSYWCCKCSSWSDTTNTGSHCNNPTGGCTGCFISDCDVCKIGTRLRAGMPRHDQRPEAEIRYRNGLNIMPGMLMMCFWECPVCMEYTPNLFSHLALPGNCKTPHCNGKFNMGVHVWNSKFHRLGTYDLEYADAHQPWDYMKRAYASLKQRQQQEHLDVGYFQMEFNRKIVN